MRIDRTRHAPGAYVDGEEERHRVPVHARHRRVDVPGAERDDGDPASGQLDAQAPNHLGRLTVFAGVRDLPTRVKCAILPWHTLHAALNSEASVTTEADADPMNAPVGNA